MFNYRGESIATKWGIDTRGQEETDVADKPKALPYQLRVNLRKLVEKGAPGIHKGVFLGLVQKQYLSELNVGKVFKIRSWN